MVDSIDDLCDCCNCDDCKVDRHCEKDLEAALDYIDTCLGTCVHDTYMGYLTCIRNNYNENHCDAGECWDAIVGKSKSQDGNLMGDMMC